MLCAGALRMVFMRDPSAEQREDAVAASWAT